MRQEQQALVYTGDFLKKIIIVRDAIKPWHSENGILIMGIWDFLLNSNSLEF